jgi:hypothetical protein
VGQDLGQIAVAHRPRMTKIVLFHAQMNRDIIAILDNIINRGLDGRGRPQGALQNEFIGRVKFRPIAAFQQLEVAIVID